MTDQAHVTKSGEAGAGNSSNRPVASAFGDIVNVLMRTDTFRELKLADLDWLVMPALRSGQFALAHGDPRPKETREADAAGSEKPNIPIAVVLWAYVSNEVDAKLRSQTDATYLKLEPGEWRTGDIPWIVAAGGVPEALRAILGHMTTNVFTDHPANIMITENGAIRVVKLSPPKAQMGEQPSA